MQENPAVGGRGSQGERCEGGGFFLPAVCRERCHAAVVELEPALRHRVLVVGVER